MLIGRYDTKCGSDLGKLSSNMHPSEQGLGDNRMEGQYCIHLVLTVDIRPH